MSFDKSVPYHHGKILASISQLKEDRNPNTATSTRNLPSLDISSSRSVISSRPPTSRSQTTTIGQSSLTPSAPPNHSTARVRGPPSPFVVPPLSSALLASSPPSASHQRGYTNSPNNSSQGLTSPRESSFEKISVAQLSILFETNGSRDGSVKWNQQKSDRARQLLESGGQGVFALYVRKAILLNHAFIFAKEKGSRHDTHRLLQDNIEEIRRDPLRAFTIVDAIDAARDEQFRDFDVVTFVSHFFQDLSSQIVLAAAFASSLRPILCQASQELVEHLLNQFYQNGEQDSLGVEYLGCESLALVSTALAVHTPTTALDNGVGKAFQSVLATGSAALEPALDMTSQLWKLPDRDRTIIDAFKQRGPRSAASRHSIEDVVSSLPSNAFSPAEVSNAMLFILFAQPSQHYNLNEFISVTKASPRSRQLDWNAVVKGLDRPELRIHCDPFTHLFRALQHVAADTPGFDMQGLWAGQWSNARTQVSFLRSFFEMHDVPSSQIPRFQHAFTAAEFQDASDGIREHVESLLEKHHCNFYAIKAVFDIILSSDTMAEEDENASAVLHTIAKEHLLEFMLALAHITIPTSNWTAMQERFLESCFKLYLEDQAPESTTALEALFHQDRQMVESLCRVTFHADPRQTESIARRAQQLGWTDFLLQSYNTPLALDIACLMSKQQPEFDLEQWVSHSIRSLGPAERTVVGNVLWKFLRIKADDEYRSQKDGSSYQSIPLNLRTVFVLLWKVQDLLEDREGVKAAQNTCLTTYPRLMNFGTDFDHILEAASHERGQKLAPETDLKMSDLFGQMYRAEMTIRDMINEMRRYKTSENPQLQDLFCCIVHGLFDEYGCYGEYPEEALEKTALLFGSIVKFRLLPPIPQEYGLALIVDAVRNHVPDTPMHRFGIEALLQLGDQLVEWPEVCAMLLQIPGLQHPEIMQRAQEGVANLSSHGGIADRNGHDEFPLPNGSADQLGLDVGARGFRSLHADSPPTDTSFHDPDTKSQEKILFVINNLSKENMDSKFSDLQDVLKVEHYQWFAAYLVEQRARLELNNQELYNICLTKLDDATLYEEVLRETYVSIVKIMSARSTMDSQVERTHLKNLGAWLGSLTLARDKPIKHRNIYFLDLLLEAFDTQRLVIVIPFTCKVLVQGKDSIVFQPPNPWLMEILGVLLELYQFGDLKLNLKFEIEVLCKDLSLDHKKVEPASWIREYQQQQQHIEELANVSALDNIDEYDLTLRGNRLRETFSVAEIMQSLPDLDEVLRFPPPSGSPQDQIHVRTIIKKAVQRAIEEIIAPVVERSITIASLSTSQLVSKDYAVESGVEKFGSAAKEMVKSLAGSLALVTCKEPLRMSIQNYIRQHLEEIGGTFMAEGQILMTVNDNLDIAAQLIKEAAERRAVPEMDSVIEAELEDRRRFADENPNGDFFGQNLNRWSTWIPEPYKMIPGGLNEAQRAVYEDFERRVHGMNAGHIQNASTDSTGRQLPDVLNETLAMPNLSTPAGQPVLPHQSPMTQHESRANSAMPQHRMNGLPDSMPPAERLSIMIDDVSKAARTSSVNGLRELGRDDPLYLDIRHILMLFNTPSPLTMDYVARHNAEKITSMLLRQPPQNSLEAEFLAFMLHKLCVISEGVGREVMRWITGNEESLLGNAFVVASFVAVSLMEFNRVDSVIASAMREHSDMGLRLLRDLMDLTLFNNEPMALRADFVQSIVALYAWLKDEPKNPIALEISQKLKAHGVPEFALVALNDKAKAKEDQMIYVFKEWCSLFDNSAYIEATHTGFLRDLRSSQLINSAEDLVTFLRLSIDTAIEHFEIELSSFRGSLASAFNKIDALALLLILLVRHQGEENGAVKINKAAYLDTILSLIVLIVHNHQELRGINFNQRVFTRLFGSILYSYAEFKFENSPDHINLMSTFCKNMKALQPALIPAFVFGWTTLVSHRVLVEGMLRHGDSECALQYKELVGLMLEYPAYLMENYRLHQIADFLTRGVYKNIFVLQNDFPDFVCENFGYFCVRTPLAEPSIRNVILAAQPFGLVEPNPLTPNLRVDRLEDMKKPPNISTDITRALEIEGLNTVLTLSLRKSTEQEGFIKKLIEVLENEERNVPFVNRPARDRELFESLVISLVQDALSNNIKFDGNSNHVQLISKLLTTLEPKQKYLLVTSMFDQLRFPNSHTDFFCKVVLHLWGTNSNVSDEQSYLREVMIRVLRERIDPLRPNPWGAIIVFKELSENSNYGFWDTQPFVNEPELRQRLVMAARGGH